MLALLRFLRFPGVILLVVLGWVWLDAVAGWRVCNCCGWGPACQTTADCLVRSVAKSSTNLRSHTGGPQAGGVSKSKRHSLTWVVVAA